MFVNTAAPEPAPGALIAFEKNGDPATKVDLLLLGDGYTAAERRKFEADSRRLLAVLFSTSPFKERRSDFNVWGLVPAAKESGISRPSGGIHRSNPISSTYDAFGSERYVLAFDNKAFRRHASYAPYDVVEIVVNGRTYGGGGIYGLYSTVAADNAFAPYVFVHEFGHHFAALADEYYTSPVAYLPSATRDEPWEPNVTALRDPNTLKWKDLVKPGTPLPTPWPKDAYETASRESQARRARLRADKRPEAEMEALFAEERRRDDVMFATSRGMVGAFEGARYEAKGFYRPEANCIMFTRADFFCAVCRRALEQVIDTYSREVASQASRFSRCTRHACAEPRQLPVERLAVAQASAKELRPVGDTGLRIGLFWQQSPQLRVMPAELLPRTVAVGPDALAQPPDLGYERVAIEGRQIVVHGFTPDRRRRARRCGGHSWHSNT